MRLQSSTFVRFSISPDVLTKMVIEDLRKPQAEDFNSVCGRIDFSHSEHGELLRQWDDIMAAHQSSLAGEGTDGELKEFTLLKEGAKKMTEPSDGWDLRDQVKQWVRVAICGT